MERGELECGSGNNLEGQAGWRRQANMGNEAADLVVEPEWRATGGSYQVS